MLAGQVTDTSVAEAETSTDETTTAETAPETVADGEVAETTDDTSEVGDTDTDTDASCPPEQCENALDDDCDGITDEGCSPDDVDGDGVSAPDDCNDHDSGIFPGREEPCIPAAFVNNEAKKALYDVDCDGNVTACHIDDHDGDGYTALSDCDDANPLLFPGAAEKCGDQIDQDCKNGDLACDALTDGDHDGWPSALGGKVVDCDDGSGAIYPGAAEICNGKDDDCDGFVDEGNPGGGVRCGSDEGECEKGETVCENWFEHRGEVVCEGSVAGTDELCNGKDDDCDAATDEEFVYEAAPLGFVCDGRGECGEGIVECTADGQDATCSTNTDGSASMGAPEACNGRDDDCDGVTDDGLEAEAKTHCLTGACAQDSDAVSGTCTSGQFTCTMVGNPNWEAVEVSCDAIDNDCDGATDEGFGVGQPCDSTDPDTCADDVQHCSTDGLGTICENLDVAGAEVCDGLDNDCDGDTDEGLVLVGALSAADEGKAIGAACGAGSCVLDGPGVVACDQGGVVCQTPIPPSDDICDGLDNDCDGAVDEPFKLGGSVVYGGGPWSADPARVLGDLCGTGACGGGRVVCAGAESLRCDKVATNVAPETCDSADNDCDGKTDEDFGVGGTVTMSGARFEGDNGKVLGASCGTGACVTPGQMGVVSCDAADPQRRRLTCTTPVAVSADAKESCDALDNDCDGSTDEAFAARASLADPTDQDNEGVLVTYSDILYSADNGKTLGVPCGVGICSGGTVVCAASQVALACNTVVALRAGAETCNGLDDTCNGGTDEGSVDTDTDGTADCVDTDDDADGIPDDGGSAPCKPPALTNCDDNCPLIPNANQSDSNGDGIGDACSADDDGDQVPNGSDNCPQVSNTQQTDADTDGVGDACDTCTDADVDGWGRTGLTDSACAKGSADDCDDAKNNTSDPDKDNLCGAGDNCPNAANPTQLNSDSNRDATGDACDTCTDADNDGWRLTGTPGIECARAAENDCDDANGNASDGDKDNVCGAADNCPNASNPTQANADGDAAGDACDTCTDADGDGWRRSGTTGAGCARTTEDDCDDAVNNTSDPDKDNICGGSDNCPNAANASQANIDDDSLGDACDNCSDKDGDGWGRAGYTDSGCARGTADDCDDSGTNATDGDVTTLGAADPDNVCGASDNCPTRANANQANLDADATGDACDTCTDVDADGWGRTGYDRSGCSKGTTVDCDDTVGSPNDSDRDNVCTGDNCPATANNDQANADGDATGDACDTCTDVDRDGWGRAGLGDSGCAKGASDDCDDAGSNATDVDRTPAGAADPDNVCGSNDNCPTTANSNQADLDHDNVGDACDPCVDLDDDGLGRPGHSSTCRVPSVDDCDDVPGNGADFDGDNICALHRGTICTGGAYLGCDDNCPEVDNPGQEDKNGNGIGDACDTQCGAEPYEVCDDCIDNDCDSQTDESDATGSGCAIRRRIAITADQVDRNGVGIKFTWENSASITFDHQFYVDSGMSTSTGAGVHVYRRIAQTGTWYELDRVLDTDSSWMSRRTKIWFRLQEDIPYGATDVEYYLYIVSSRGAIGFVPANESNVFLFADSFSNQGDGSSLANGWQVTEYYQGEAVVQGQELVVNPYSGYRHRPTMVHAFPQVTSGRLQADITYNWSSPQQGKPFGVLMQMGYQDASGGSFGSYIETNGLYPSAGAALGLLWYQTDNISIGYYNMPPTSFGDFVPVIPSNGSPYSTGHKFDGIGTISVTLDLDRWEYDVSLPAAGYWEYSLPLATNWINAIRLTIPYVYAQDFTSRGFDNIRIRRLPDAVATFDVQSPLGPACALHPAGALVRYYFDDTRDKVSDGKYKDASHAVTDGAGVPITLPLTRTAGSAGPDFTNAPYANHGIAWSASGGGGVAEADYTGTKLVASPGGLVGTAATFEFVMEAHAVEGWEAILGLAQYNFGRLEVWAASSPTYPEPYFLQILLNDRLLAMWNLDLVAAGRSVFHIVLDTGGANSVALYRDGQYVDPYSVTPPATGETIALLTGPGAKLRVGNNADGYNSFMGAIYYAAIYARALSEAEIRTNTGVLRAIDDRRSDMGPTE